MWRRNGRSARRDSGARSTVVPGCGEKRIAPAVGGKARRMQRATRGLAAAAFADQRQRLAARDGEAHILHRAHAAGLALQQPAADREGLAAAASTSRTLMRSVVRRVKQLGDARRSAARSAGGTSVAQRPAITSGQRGWKGAAGRARARMRHRAADRRQPLARHGADIGHRAQQRARIGMARAPRTAAAPARTRRCGRDTSPPHRRPSGRSRPCRG